MSVPYNILLIVCDDLGVDQVDCYGVPGGTGTTPTLDALASSGLRFQWSYAMPVCSPTRMTIHSGRLPGRTGIWYGELSPHDLGGYGVLEWEPAPSEVFLGSQLRAAGYRTGHFGKWHLHHPTSASAYDFVRQKGGFDEHRGWTWNFDPRSNGSHATETATHYFQWPRLVNGVIDNAGAPAPGSLVGASGSPTDFCANYVTTQTVDDALAWIASASSPFFASIAFQAPHVPLQAPPSNLHSQPLVYPAGHPKAGAPVPDGTIWAALDLNCKNHGFSRPSAKPYLRAMRQAMDQEIGRLFDSLGAAALANTIVVVIGDNGTDCGTFDGNGENVQEGAWNPSTGKLTMGELGIRVPLIVAGPVVASPGSISNALVVSSDLFATFHALAGIPLPSGVALDSISFLDVLTGASPLGHRTNVLCQYGMPVTNPATATAATFTRRWYAIRGPQYKLIRRVTGNPGSSFFQISDASGAPKDQYETTDLLTVSGGINATNRPIFQNLSLQLDAVITQVEHLTTH